MPIFAVSRSQDTEPFVLLDARDAIAAIAAIRDLDALGELIVQGYFGSEDENGYRAESASEKQVADWTANSVHGIARGDLSIAGKRPSDVDRAPGAPQYVMLIAEPDFRR
jgi:hypothetical protein